MSEPLHVLPVAARGLEGMLCRLPRLFTLFFAVWLASVAVDILVGVTWHRVLGLNSFPWWLQSQLWAPFAALAGLGMAKVSLWDEPHPQARLTDDAWWLFALACAAAFAVVDVASWACQSALGSDSALEALSGGDRDAGALALATSLIWIVKAAATAIVSAVLFALATATLAEDRRTRLRLFIRDVRLWAIVAVAMALGDGCDYVWGKLVELTGLPQHRPLGFDPWRQFLLGELQYRLLYLPSAFAGFAVQSMIIGEAYRRRLGFPDWLKPAGT